MRPIEQLSLELLSKTKQVYLIRKVLYFLPGLVLIAGFVIFCFSGFGGTQALGWLTSLTLVLATLTNLVFLPVLLLALDKNRVVRKKTSEHPQA